MDRSEILYAAVQMPLVALSFWSSWFIIPSVALAAIYGMASMKTAKATDHRLLSFSRSLSKSCANTGVNRALDESISSAAAPAEIRELAVRARLGDIDGAGCANAKRRQNPAVRELYEILALGLRSGMDISNNLRVFTSNLEAETESRNRMARNSLNMDVLSRMGIAFFVPLFGGIGASIIGASGSIAGSNVALLKQSFEIVLIIYIAVMSYVMNSFRPSGRPGDAIVGSVQSAAIGSAIMRLSSSIITYAI